MSNYFRTLLHLAGLLFAKCLKGFLRFLGRGREGNVTNVHIFPPFSPHYQIKIDNCKDERTAALLENPKTVGVWWVERLWLSDFRFFFFFPLLLLIASIVWRASCGKCSAHRYHTHAYYPWQKEWDEKERNNSEGAAASEPAGRLFSFWLEKIG